MRVVEGSRSCRFAGLLGIRISLEGVMESRGFEVYELAHMADIHMGSCLHWGPLVHPQQSTAPFKKGTPKRDPNADNIHSTSSPKVPVRVACAWESPCTDTLE